MQNSTVQTDLLDTIQREAVIVAPGGLLDDEVDELEAEAAHVGLREDDVRTIRVVGVIQGIVWRAQHQLCAPSRLAAVQDGQARRTGDGRRPGRGGRDERRSDSWQRRP